MSHTNGDTTSTKKHPEYHLALERKRENLDINQSTRVSLTEASWAVVQKTASGLQAGSLFFFLRRPHKWSNLHECGFPFRCVAPRKQRLLHRAQRTRLHTFISVDTLHDKPCTRHEQRDTTCASQQWDWRARQSRSPHSFVQLKHRIHQLETDQQTSDQPTSDTSRGFIGNGRKQSVDATSQVVCAGGRSAIDVWRRCQSRHIFKRSGNPTSASRTPSLKRPRVALKNLWYHFKRGDIACLSVDEVFVSRVSARRHFALTTTPMGRNTMKEDAVCVHQFLHVERGSTTSCSDDNLRTS